MGVAIASGTVRFDTDAFIIALSNTLPTAGQAGQTYSPSNITEIATLSSCYTQGTGIVITTGSNTNSGGTYTWVGTAAQVLNSNAGNFGPFQYAILYDNTSSTKPLLGWWAAASAITMATTDTFQVSWGSNQIIQWS